MSIVRAKTDQDARLTVAMVLEDLPDETPEPAPVWVVAEPAPVAVEQCVVPGTQEAYLTLRANHERIFWPARTGKKPDPDCKVIAPESVRGEGAGTTSSSSPSSPSVGSSTSTRGGGRPTSMG